MSSGHLRPVEGHADGQHHPGSPTAPRRDPWRFLDAESARHIHERGRRIHVRNEVEAALFHEDRRRLLRLPGAVGRAEQDLAPYYVEARHGLVDGSLSRRPDAAADRAVVRRLPLGELQHRDENAPRNGTSAARSATAPAARTSATREARPSSIQRSSTTSRANDVCIQCHSQGKPRTNPIEGRYYDWPVGYQPGDRLSDVWKLEEHHLGKQTFTHWPDGTAHKNRMQGNDYVQSQMYRRACGAMRVTIRTARNTRPLLRLPGNAVCLQCHSAVAASLDPRGSLDVPYSTRRRQRR